MPVEGAEKADSEGHIHESGLQRWFFTSEPCIFLPQDRVDADSLCRLTGRPDKLTEEKLTENCEMHRGHIQLSKCLRQHA